MGKTSKSRKGAMDRSRRGKERDRHSRKDKDKKPKKPKKKDIIDQAGILILEGII